MKLRFKNVVLSTSPTHSPTIICISPISEEKRGQCDNRTLMITQGRAVQLAAPLSLTLIWQRHTGNKSKQQRLHNIRVQGQGSEEMHPAHAENNYPNTFSWSFGTLTRDTGQPHGALQQPLWQVSATTSKKPVPSSLENRNPWSPIQSSFPGDSRTGISYP